MQLWFVGCKTYNSGERPCSLRLHIHMNLLYPIYYMYIVIIIMYMCYHQFFKF